MIHRSFIPQNLLVRTALLIALTLAGISTAMAAPVVKASSVGNHATRELNGIRETVLPNGLTILTREVHSAPVVYFGVYYRVGSVDEEVGETGMSHLMEHMMFKGTKTRGPGVISATLQDNGADFNASTSFDRTEYHETLASNRLELAMQIESDRMVNSVFNEAQHQKEMTVVRSEYEAGENDPYTVLSKAVRLAAYEIHPYRWMTIGFRADIEHITRDEMYAYYKNYYTPNNAVVVIVGDFNTAKAIAMAKKYFGPLRPHTVQTHFITPEPPQEGERRVIVRRAGTTPIVQIAYHIPAFGNPDRYAIDVLESVLANGRTGRFFQDLVQTGLAFSADAYDYGLRDPDLFIASATVQPGHTLQQVEQALLGEIQKLQETPITPQELKRVINQSEASYIFSKDSVTQMGSDLGENAMRGDWRYGETYLEHLRKVTPEDVQRVAKTYLVTRNRTVGWFDPLPTSGAPSTQPTSMGPVGPAHYRSEAALRQSKVPMSHPEPVSNTHSTGSTVVMPTRFTLPNGLTVVVQENHANPTISISGALLSAGDYYDPPNKRGLASFTASLLSRGAANQSTLDIARSLEDVGASLHVSAHQEYATIRGRSLKRDLPLLLTVLSNELRYPNFSQQEIDRARSEQLAEIEASKDDTGALADIAFRDAIFPAGSPYTIPTFDEQAAVLRSITRDDLVAFHATHYAPNRMILTIVGDITSAEAKELVTHLFGDWPRVEGIPHEQIAETAVKPGPARVVVIPVPDKAQVNVFYGYPGQVRRSDPDFYTVVTLDTILGGGAGLSSRLATSVRDRAGLVYGIYADTDAGIGAGPFEVQFGANPANVDKAIQMTREQIALMHDKGATRQEVQNAINYITGSYSVALSTNGAVAQQLLISQIFGLGLDYIQKHNSYYKKVTVAQVNAAARKYLYPDAGALVMAGTYTGKYAQAALTAK